MPEFKITTTPESERDDMSDAQRRARAINVAISNAEISRDPMARYEESLNPIQQGALGFDRAVGRPISGFATTIGDAFGANDWADQRREVARAGDEAWDRTSAVRPPATSVGTGIGYSSQMGYPGRLAAQSMWSGLTEIGESFETNPSAQTAALEGAEGAAWGALFGSGSELGGRVLMGINSGREMAAGWLSRQAEDMSRAVRGVPDPRVANAAPTDAAAQLDRDAMLDLGGDGIDPPPGGGGGRGGGAGDGGGIPDGESWQQTAERQGFQTGRADRTQNRTNIQLEQGWANAPNYSDIPGARYRHNEEVLGGHAARAIGVEPSPDGAITMQMMRRAEDQINDTYSRLRGAVDGTGGLEVDPMRIEAILTDPSNSTEGVTALGKILNDPRYPQFTAGGTLSGSDWSSLRSKIRKDAKALNNAGQGDAALELYGLSTYFDDLADEVVGGRNSPLGQEYRQAREAYRNLLALERTGVVSKADRTINPDSLYNSLARVKGRQFTNGRLDTDFDQAAGVAPQLQRHSDGSRTALNLNAQNPQQAQAMASNFAKRPFVSAYLEGKNPMLDYMFGDFSNIGLMQEAGGGIERALDPDLGIDPN